MNKSLTRKDWIIVIIMTLVLTASSVAVIVSPVFSKDITEESQIPKPVYFISKLNFVPYELILQNHVNNKSVIDKAADGIDDVFISAQIYLLIIFFIWALVTYLLIKFVEKQRSVLLTGLLVLLIQAIPMFYYYFR